MLRSTSFQRTIPATPEVLCAVFRRHVHPHPRPDFAFHGTSTERGFEATRNADYFRDNFLWSYSPTIAGRFIPTEQGTRVEVSFGWSVGLAVQGVALGICLAIAMAIAMGGGFSPAFIVLVISAIPMGILRCLHVDIVRGERWAIEAMLDEAEQERIGPSTAACLTTSRVDHPTP